MAVISWAKRFVSKVYSYKKVFDKNDADVKAVLADLARIAPIDPTLKVAKPYNKNSNEVYIMIGRRQVVSHILGKINMTDEELSAILKREQIDAQQENIM